MKKFFYFYSLLLTAFLWLGSGTMWGDELTVANGTKTTYQTPVYGYYCDRYVRSQIIYPASMLTSMNGNNITAMTFYFETPSSNALSSTFQLYLKEVASTTTALSTSWMDMTGATKVFEGTIEANNTTTKTLVIEFDTPFSYNGGSLIFDIKNTASGGSYAAKKYGEYTCVFYGRKAAADESSTLTGYASSATITPTRGDIRPKTTFTYEAASSCKKPTALTKGEVTTTTAAFTWTAGATETSWQYVCLPAAETVDWSAASVQTTNSAEAIVESLTAGTDYIFYLRADCGSAQSGNVSSAFKTNYGLPFSEDFTGLTSGIPAGWDNSQGTTISAGYKWSYYNYAGHTATPCVRFDSYNNSGNNTNFLKTPAIYVDKAAALSFWYKNPTGGDFSVFYSLDGGTTMVETPLASDLTGQSAWTQEEIALPAATIGKNVVIVFKGTSNYGSGDAYIYLDDISITEVTGCSKPTGVTATDVIYNGATINWAEGSTTNWKLQYSTDQENWTNANSGNWISGATSFGLTGLESGSTYYVHIQADGCDQWSNAISFTPNCVVPTGLEVPLATITSNQAVVNWTAGNGETNWTLQYKKSSDASWSEPIAVATTPTYTLTGLSAASTYQVKVAATCNGTYTSAVSFPTACGAVTLPFSENFGGSIDCWTMTSCHASTGISDGAFRFRWTETPPQYLISPEIEASANQISLEFNYKIGSANNPETFAVGYSTTTNDISAFIWGTESTYTNTTYATYSDLLPIGVKYIAIKCSSNDKYYLYIDNFSVSEYIEPTCFVPTAPSCDSKTATTATLSWTKGNDSDDAWVVEYSTASNFSGSSEVPATTNSSFVLSGLSAQTTYYVRVKTKCGESEYSDPSDDINFTTACPAQALPFEENFSSAISCWTMVDCTSGTGVSSGAFKFQYNTTPPQYLISPELEASAKPVQVAFDYKAASSMFEESFKVGYSTTTNAISAFIWGTEQTGLTNTSYTNYAETLPAGVKYVAIQYTANDQSALYIDNFSVSVAPSCFAPNGLSAATSITPEGATFTWSASGHGEDTYQWAVALGSADPEWVDDAAHKVSTTTKTLTGLTAGTNYKFHVRSYCGASEQSAAITSAAFTPVLNAPTDLAASALTASGATISWTAATGVSNYEYSLLEGDVYLPDWNNAVAVNGATSVNLTELNPSTTYSLWVRSVYNTSKSGNSLKLSFTTKCEAIAVNATYTEDFNSLDNGAIPGCWDNSEGTTTTASYKWKATTGGQSGKCLVFNGVDNGYNKTNILATPTFTLSSDADLVFYWKNAKAGEYKVQISVDGAAREDFITGLVSKSAWTIAEKALTDYDGHSVQFFFCGTSIYDGNANLYLDEFQIVPVSCRKPASDPVVNSKTGTTASISWGEGGASNYQFAIAPKDETPVWDANNVVTATTKTVEGLTPLTNYDFYVRTYCDEDNQSDARKVSFQTECADYVTLPFNENFNSLSADAIPACWNNDEGTSEDYYKWKAVTYSGHNTSTCVRFNSSTNDADATNVLATPAILLGEGNLLTFWAKNPTGGDFKVQIEGEGIEREDLLTGLTGIADWTLKYAAIPAKFDNKKVQLFFCATSNGGDANAYIYIDDVRVARGEAFADGENTGVETRLGGLEGQTLDFVMTRPMQYNGYYNTLCLPFSVSESEMAEEEHPFYNCTVKAFDYAVVAGEELQLAITAASGIEAGVPCFLKYDGTATADKTVLLFKEVTISAPAPGSKEDGDVTYAGIFNTITATPESEGAHVPSCLFVGGQNGLYWPTTARKMNAFRAYFSITTGAGAPIRRGMSARIVERAEVATGCENVNAAEKAVKLLENGHVIIIRNGVKYNIQGQIISK